MFGEAGEEAAGGVVVRGEETRVIGLSYLKHLLRTCPQGSSSLESAPGAAVVDPTTEVSPEKK